MEFILASNNQKKLLEMREILRPLGFVVRSQYEAGIDLDVEETGETFLENARLKAQAVVDHSGMAAIADDSGLVVEALQGAPGIYSARYGGERCRSDEDRVAFLLENMVGEERRNAKFVSAIVAIFPGGRSIEAQGEWHGEILDAPRGNGGFGYDPVFYVPEERASAAELSPERKNTISHRAKAMQNFIEQLEKQYADK